MQKRCSGVLEVLEECFGATYCRETNEVHKERVARKIVGGSQSDLSAGKMFRRARV
jgi:hypothetical protein